MAFDISAPSNYRSGSGCACCSTVVDCTDNTGTSQIRLNLLMSILAIRKDPDRTGPIFPSAPPNLSPNFYVGLSTRMRAFENPGQGSFEQTRYSTDEWRQHNTPNIASVGANNADDYNADGDCTIDEVADRFESQAEAWKYRNPTVEFQEWGYMLGSVTLERLSGIPGVGDLTIAIGASLGSMVRLPPPGAEGGPPDGPRSCASVQPFGTSFGHVDSLDADPCSAIGGYVVGNHTLVLGGAFQDEIDVLISAL